MLHLEYLKEDKSDKAHFLTKATGRYYTGEDVGRLLAKQVAETFHRRYPTVRSIRVADPFGGDGRLIQWVIESWCEAGFPDVCWQVETWDIDDGGFQKARSALKRLAAHLAIEIQQSYKVLDTFAEALESRGAFDVVITNPPWELLKPDRRELQTLAPSLRGRYVSRMRTYDEWLTQHYPLSQPKSKFAGWGTNLSRVGLEASLALARKGGVVGAVLPASFLADDQTSRLRQHLLAEHKLHSVCYYPAEAKFYGTADVASIAAVMTVGGPPASSLTIATYHPATRQLEESRIKLDHDVLREVEYVMPVSFGAKALTILNRLAQTLPSWRELESTAPASLWAGREVDETGVSKWLVPRNGRAPLFIKGRMIGRYTTVETPSQSLIKPDWTPPSSFRFRRIAWRDVSRPSQKRRMIATLIEPGCVAGNSLGVAYFRDLAEAPLLALLGVMNSLCFEFQLRAHLATGHVSLSSLRKVAVPSLAALKSSSVLQALVVDALKAGDSAAFAVDAYVAKFMYGLTHDEYETILEAFGSVTDAERHAYSKSYQNLSRPRADTRSTVYASEAAAGYCIA